MNLKLLLTILLINSNLMMSLINFLGEGNVILNEPANHFYSVHVRPQQIVTLRFTCSSVKPISQLTDWTPLVPESKRAFLNKYNSKLVGHLPFK